MREHIVKRQKFNRAKMLRSKFVMRELTQLIGEHKDFRPTHASLLGSLPGWDGSSTAAWRERVAIHF